MKFLKILLVMSLLTLCVSANEVSQYILITKTSKKSNLKSIKAKLEPIKVKMYVKKSNSMYYVYSELYKNDTSAQKALRKVRQSFPSALLIKSEAKSIKKEKSNVKEADKKMFISLNYGSSEIEIDTGDIEDNETKGSDSSYGIEFGYMFDENFYTTLAYLNSSTEDIAATNIYMSANYQENVAQNTSVYIGLLAGLSTLELTGYEDSSASNAMLIGAQLGATYDLHENIAISLCYQIMKINHTIELSDTATSIEFTRIENIELGLLYRF